MGFLDIYENGFTAYNCGILLMCPFLPEETRKAIYPVVACTSWAILTSFHTGAFIETNVFDRLAQKYNMHRRVWDMGNFICHVMPTIAVTYWQPSSISYYHGIIGACMNYSWVLLVTNGTYILDRVYIPCEKHSWYKMISVSLLTELITPYVYNHGNRIINGCNSLAYNLVKLYRNKRLL